MVGGEDGDGSLAMFHQSRYEGLPREVDEGGAYTLANARHGAAPQTSLHVKIVRHRKAKPAITAVHAYDWSLFRPGDV